MIRSFLVLMLGAAACWGQTASSPAPQAAGAGDAQKPPATAQPPSAGQISPKPATPPAASDAAATVPATEAIITIHGVCAATPAKPAGAANTKAGQAACTTSVTKADFEKLLAAVNPGNQSVAPAMRRNLAQAYVELLTFSQAARKAGIDKDPKFAEVMRIVRMRTLEDFYRRSLEEKYRTPPAADIQAYYNQNLGKYEELKLSRIFIPAKNPSSPSKDDWEKKAAQEANDIHDRAAKGEDFEKLQKEAYTTLGLTIAPPNTTMGTRRRGMIAPNEEQELFTLKPGDVSKLEQEPAGYIVYKIESKQTLPVEQVKDEISRELFRQKMDTQLKSVTGVVHADFNDSYFGPPAPPPSVTRPMPPGAREPGEREGPKPPSAKPPGSTPPATAPNQAPPK